ncbi:MAG: TetR/AcrR family transcriptional regulator [Bdellovibrionales bacterium]
MKRKSKSRRLDPAARKQEIIVAAIDCIAENAVHNTSFAQIAKAAGVQQPLVHYYFPSMDTLLMDCVMLVLEDLKAHMIKEIEKHAHQPLKALFQFSVCSLDWLAANPKYQPFWLYFYHLCATSERFRAMNNEIRRTGRERIRFLILRVCEKSKITLKEPWDSDALAWSIQTWITGFMTMAASEQCDLRALKKLAAAQMEDIVALHFS